MCCGSMLPTLTSGQSIFVEFYVGGPLNIGDIVGTDKVTHRIVAIEGDLIKLRGDNNTYSDPWVKQRSVQFVIRYILKN